VAFVIVGFLTELVNPSGPVQKYESAAKVEFNEIVAPSQTEAPAVIDGLLGVFVLTVSAAVLERLEHLPSLEVTLTRTLMFVRFNPSNPTS
jgi:hypothetical protein